MCKGAIDKKDYVERAQDMSKSVQETVLKVLPFFKRIHLCGEGESLVLDGFIDTWLRMPQGKYYSLSTNGYRLTRDVSRTFVERNLNLLFVSLDGVSDETYNYIRGGFSGLGRVLNNVANLKDEKKTAGKTTPEVIITMVGMKENAHEVGKMIRTAKELGASTVVLQALSEKTGTHGSSLIHDIALLKKAIVEGNMEAKEQGIKFVVREPYLSLGSDMVKQKLSLKKVEYVTKRCIDPWSFVYFLANGDLACCCYMMPRYIFGRAESFVADWQGEKMHAIREGLLVNRVIHDICKTCPVVEEDDYYKLRNDLFNFIVGERPQYI